MENYKNEEWLRNEFEAKGKRRSEIAKECGVTTTTITSWLNKFNITVYCPYKDKYWLYREIVEKRRSSEDIGNEFGVDRKNIDWFVKKFNITKPKKLRPRMPEGTKLTLECTHCGNEYEKDLKAHRKCLSKGKTRHFCSRKCADESHREFISGENNPNFGGKWYGQPIQDVPKEILRERGLRSVEKRRQSGVLDEQIKKMRDASLEYYSTEEGQKKRRMCGVASVLSQAGKRSSIEAIISDELKKLNIKFEEQVRIGYWVADFYIPDYNLIIETHGDYWHGNPLVFDNLTPRQKKRRVMDKGKETYSRNRGYNYLILWEKDINSRLEWCVNQIKDAIRTKNDGSFFIVQ